MQWKDTLRRDEEPGTICVWTNDYILMLDLTVTRDTTKFFVFRPVSRWLDGRSQGVTDSAVVFSALNL